MKIFITENAHRAFRRFRNKIFYEQERMTKGDLVLVCRAFSWIWHGDPRGDTGGWRNGHIRPRLCLLIRKTTISY